MPTRDQVEKVLHDLNNSVTDDTMAFKHGVWMIPMFPGDRSVFVYAGHYGEED